MGKKKQTKTKKRFAMNEDAKRQIVSLLVVAVVSVVSVVTYKTLDNHFQTAYTAAIMYSSGALTGGDDLPEYRVKNISIQEQNNKFYLKWDNLNKPNTSYVVQYAKTNTPITWTDNVYSGSIGTFIGYKDHNPSAQVHYYSSNTPAQIGNLDKVKSSSPAIKDAGSGQSAYEITTAKKGDGYIYWVQTLVNDVATSVSPTMLITDWKKIGTKGVTFPFKDVPTTEWFYTYVSHLLNEGVLSASDKFRPGDDLKRSEAAKIALAMKQISVDNIDANLVTDHFCDVSPKAWFAKHVIAMKSKGWIGGYPSTKCKAGAIFDGNRSVTRAEFLKIIIAAHGVDVSAYKKASTFTDVGTNEWFTPYINYALDKGMISMSNDKKFNPNKGISRAAMAKIVSKGLLVL